MKLAFNLPLGYLGPHLCSFRDSDFFSNRWWKSIREFFSTLSELEVATCD